MIHRATRTYRLNGYVWAILAALSATPMGLALEEPTPDTSRQAASTENPTRRRGVIPPPRQFNLDESRPGNAASRPQRSVIPPPRQFAISSDRQPQLSVQAVELEPESGPMPAASQEGTAPVADPAAPARRSDETIPPSPTSAPAAAPAPEAIAESVAAPAPAQSLEPVAPDAAGAAGPTEADHTAEPIVPTAPIPSAESIAVPATTTAPAAEIPAAPAPTDTTPTTEPAAPSTEPTAPVAESTAPAADPQAIKAPALDSPVGPATAAEPKRRDGSVKQAACSTCGQLHSSMGGGGGGAFHPRAGCAGGNCIPGRGPCYPPANECDTILGAFFANMYQELCCPDPCYQPRWEPAANASFFADYARPRTVTRVRYDNLEAMNRINRNEYWLKQSRSGGNFTIGGTTYRTDPSARLQQGYLYQEAAGERGSLFVEIPYRQLNPLFSPTQAGFGDINFGTKSLLFDSELLAVSFQFRTYTPSGNAQAGLGTGHFSLDPSLLFSMKLADDTYFQAQLGNWIPLNGTNHIAGGIFYWYLSLNQVLWYCTPDSPLIATLEMDGWSFENGGWTNPIVLPGQQGSFRGVPGSITAQGNGTYFNIGPGLRQSICNKLDFGGALTFATDTAHWAQPWFRMEVRFLF